jgi:hypothetical protein
MNNMILFRGFGRNATTCTFGTGDDVQLIYRTAVFIVNDLKNDGIAWFSCVL